MSDSSCCRQIRRRIGCRYGVQIYLSENRYILADKDRRSISITHTPKQYNNRNIFKGCFYKLLYEDFAVNIEQIVVRSE